MNRTKFLYRLTIMGTTVSLALATVLGVTSDADRWQLSLLAFGVLGAVVASHLRLRTILAAQRAVAAPARNVEPNSAAIDRLEETVSGLVGVMASTQKTLLQGIDDTQAAVAASESFLMAEISTLRKRGARPENAGAEARGTEKHQPTVI